MVEECAQLKRRLDEVEAEGKGWREKAGDVRKKAEAKLATMKKHYEGDKAKKETESKDEVERLRGEVASRDAEIEEKEKRLNELQKTVEEKEKLLNEVERLRGR